MKSGFVGVLAKLLLLLAACERPTSAPDVRAPASLWVSADSVNIIQGEGAALSAAVMDAAGRPIEGLRVTWASSDAAVASVDSLGLLAGLKPGAAQVTAIYSPGKGSELRREVRVVVTRLLARLEITPDPVVIDAPGLGWACQVSVTGRVYDRFGVALQAPYIRYHVVDPGIARDNSRGGGTSGLFMATLGGVATGTTRLVGTLQTDPRFTDTVEVRVGASVPTRLVLGPGPHYYAVGDTVRLPARLLNQCDGEMQDAPINFSSTRSAVFGVDPTGKLTPRAAGRAYVHARSGAWVDSALVTVADYRLSPVDTAVFLGDTITFRPEVADSTGVFQAWGAELTSSDASVLRMIKPPGFMPALRGVAVSEGEITVSARMWLVHKTARVRVQRRP